MLLETSNTTLKGLKGLVVGAAPKPSVLRVRNSPLLT